MRKSLFIAILTLVIFASCKKDRTCACEVVEPVTLQIDLQKKILKNVTKKQAQKECSNLQSSNVTDCHVLSSYY